MTPRAAKKKTTIHCTHGPTAQSLYMQWTTTLHGTDIHTAPSGRVSAGHVPQSTHSPRATASSASCP